MIEALMRRALFLGYLVATAFYFYVRIRYTLDVHWLWYSWLVLVFELWGSTSVVLFALVLTRTGGGPEKKPVKGIKTIRVFVPCYKEGLDILKPTITGALTAPVPEGYTKHVYMLDDGRDDEKRKWMESLEAAGALAHYRIRPKKPNQVNGKATNLNYTLRFLYGPSDLEEQAYEDEESQERQQWHNPKEELIAVFDADQICGHDFFMRALSAMGDCSLLLTPQCFHNVPPYIDVFNHSNTHFYEYMLPALDTWGCVSCTGTNYLLRSDSIKAMGYFAEDAVNEDYVLSLMLKRHGFRSKYLKEYLAAGEAPEDLRNIFKQRSRWCKGHMQVLMGPRNPITDGRLPLVGKIFYSIGNLSYLCCAFCTPCFLIIPVSTIWFGVFPINITRDGAFAFVVYYFVLVLTLTAAGNIGHTFRLWLSTISNNMFWFTYLKAFFNVAIAKVMKKEVVFKATDKAVSMVSTKSKGESMNGKFLDTQNIEEENRSSRPGFEGPSNATGEDPRVADISDDVSVSSATSSVEEEHAEEVSTSCCGFLRNELSPSALKEKLTGQGGELWMNIIVLLLSLSTAVAGIMNLDTSGRRGGHDVVQIVSIFWAVYNVVPCVFFLHYALFQFKGMKFVVTLGSFICIGSVIASFVMLILKSRIVYDFGEVVDKSFEFYEAQRSGQLPDDALPAWRGNSAMLDQTPDGASLSGGYYDGGDTVKYGLPMAVATSFLAWGLIEFDAGFSKGQLEKGMSTVRWSTDYFIKAHTAEFEFYAQVGDGKTEHEQWKRPEDMLRTPRIGIALTKEKPGSDVIGSTAAAMASAAMLFRESDLDYSEDLLERARELYEFGHRHRGKYSDVIPDARNTYPSTSIRDDLAWGAIWLHLATEDERYLYHAEKELDRLLEERDFNQTAISWDNVAQPACFLLYKVTKKEIYKQCVESYMDFWTHHVPTTRDGLSYLDRGDNTTSLRNTANTAMLGLAYALEGSKNGLSNTKQWTYECWGMLQLRYMLGDSGKSYVVGFGKNYPRRVHHRGATCPNSPATCSWNTFDSDVANRHVLHGALVAGPDKHDVYLDDRSDLDQSRVALDFNAGFTGALARVERIRKREGFGQCYHGDGVLKWLRVVDLPT